jgi:hypothetical protein
LKAKNASFLKNHAKGILQKKKRRFKKNPKHRLKNKKRKFLKKTCKRFLQKKTPQRNLHNKKTQSAALKAKTANPFANKNLQRKRKICLLLFF